MLRPWSLIWFAAGIAVCQALTLTNGGFEEGLVGWRDLWTRDRGAGRVILLTNAAHSGNAHARIEHDGPRDWSFEPVLRIPSKTGEVYEMTAWVRKTGDGSASLCASTWTAAGSVAEWSYGSVEIETDDGWQMVRTRWIVPEDVAALQPRFIGHGPVRLDVDDVTLTRLDDVNFQPDPSLPRELSLENPRLRLAFDTIHATFHVEDRRTGRQWRQIPLHRELRVLSVRAGERQWQVRLLHYGLGRPLEMLVRLEPDAPEWTVQLDSPGPMPTSPVRYPHPFETRPGESLVLPMNEGISFPVDDPEVELFRLIAYGGHGLCMAFWGVTDGRAGYSAIWETPDDAAVRMHRVDGRLLLAPEWDPQKRQWGYPRRLRYVFFDQGGHVAMAKRYRRHAQSLGLVRTLEQKRRANPNVDLLIGAVNVWCWDRDALGIVREMQQTGIERILWSHQQPAGVVRALNELGVLTGRYDIYQDVMDPARFPRLRGIHPDWPTEAWPHDLIRDARGRWIPGWEVETRDGDRIPCGVLCDLRAPEYARRRIAAELATHPYRARFIDTTTASPWRECYDPAHPMTRTESRRWKMELLRLVSEEMNLVTGSETGHDAAVPFVHYFEGMLSLGPYRVPDAGRNMSRIWTDVPEPVAKYQVGWRYRLPLWELVYHDCVVAQWYWGDYNNKLPALWDLRDLFNILYATPPMFMFDRKLWQEQKDRFVQSYRNVCPIVRRLGYQEMTDHRFLTPDRSVQQTRFANGVTITVNFAQAAWQGPDGEIVPGRSFRVDPAE
ncbi:glycoside hydrolase [Limisphaera sp. VF-2]|uniref:glycoside hydrolase n=1 Tax=Limisphaera sp. VF-2 TaxID=3400418 RepID=UPI001755F343